MAQTGLRRHQSVLRKSDGGVGRMDKGVGDFLRFYLLAQCIRLFRIRTLLPFCHKCDSLIPKNQ
jgi:hypothetical protein